MNGSPTITTPSTSLPPRSMKSGRPMPCPARMMPLKPRWRRSRIGITAGVPPAEMKIASGLGGNEFQGLRRGAGRGAFERLDCDYLHAGRRQQLIEQAGPHLQIGIVEAHDPDRLDTLVAEIFADRRRRGVVIGDDLERPTPDVVD